MSSLTLIGTWLSYFLGNFQTQHETVTETSGGIEFEKVKLVLGLGYKKHGFRIILTKEQLKDVIRLAGKSN